MYLILLKVNYWVFEMFLNEKKQLLQDKINDMQKEINEL